MEETSKTKAISLSLPAPTSKDSIAIGHHISIPDVPLKYLERSFPVSDANLEVTSLDIASHGCYLVAGCSNGMVLLFDLTENAEQAGGMMIGHIHAKGMHTTLIVTVKFSEDCRFCFAGVTKGSSEMMAIDLSKLLVNWDISDAWEIARECMATKASSKSKQTPSASTIALTNAVFQKQQQQAANLFTYYHSDAKLKGFGSVTRLNKPNGLELEYRLACGKGIKNVHVWQFTLHATSTDASDVTSPEGNSSIYARWNCIYDVASNGNTLTHIEFRDNGLQLLSKSAGMNLRVWDLSASVTDTVCSPTAAVKTPAGAFTDTAASNVTGKGDNASAATIPTPREVNFPKPSYLDVANSADVKFLPPRCSFCFGGSHEFALVNPYAPKEANRDAFEIPEKYNFNSSSAADISGLGYNTVGGGARGRRVTREVEHIISTDEGAHALGLCSDGGVLYFHHADGNCETDSRCPAVVDNPNQDSTSAGLDKVKQNCTAATALDSEGSDFSLHNESSPSTSPSRSTCEDGNGAGELVELTHLRRDPSPGCGNNWSNWALRRVGQRGSVVLLRTVVRSTDSDSDNSKSGGSGSSGVSGTFGSDVVVTSTGSGRVSNPVVGATTIDDIDTPSMTWVQVSLLSSASGDQIPPTELPLRPTDSLSITLATDDTHTEHHTINNPESSKDNNHLCKQWHSMGTYYVVSEEQRELLLKEKQLWRDLRIQVNEQEKRHELQAQLQSSVHKNKQGTISRRKAGGSVAAAEPDSTSAAKKSGRKRNANAVEMPDGSVTKPKGNRSSDNSSSKYVTPAVSHAPSSAQAPLKHSPNEQTLRLVAADEEDYDSPGAVARIAASTAKPKRSANTRGLAVITAANATETEEMEHDVDAAYYDDATYYGYDTSITNASECTSSTALKLSRVGEAGSSFAQLRALRDSDSLPLTVGNRGTAATTSSGTSSDYSTLKASDSSILPTKPSRKPTSVAYTATTMLAQTHAAAVLAADQKRRQPLESLKIGKTPRVVRAPIENCSLFLPSRSNTSSASPQELGSPFQKELIESFELIISCWQQEISAPAATVSHNNSSLEGLLPLPYSFSSGNVGQTYQLGTCGLQKLGVILREQDRLKSQFICEIARVLKDQIKVFAALCTRAKQQHYVESTEKQGLLAQGETASVAATTAVEFLQSSWQRQPTSVVDSVIENFEQAVAKLLPRQQLDFRGACALDCISAGIIGQRRNCGNASGGSGEFSHDAMMLSTVQNVDPPLKFRHNAMFVSAKRLQQEINTCLSRQVSIISATFV